jgi:hypothetical protein
MRKRTLTPLIAALIAAPTFILSTPTIASNGFKCPKAMALALHVGFKKKDLPTLDYIIYRESRCNPKSIGHNRRTDGTVWSSDYGLTQINNYSWITYLRNKKLVRKSSDLLDPFTNLKAAKELYDYSLTHGGNQWKQWNTKTWKGSGKKLPTLTR